MSISTHFATMTFSRLMAEKMVEQGHGHIINIASMAGKIATANSTVYAATKFAVIGFSDAFGLELADKGVYVTTVNPGPIDRLFDWLIHLETILRVLRSLSSVLNTWLKRLSVFLAKTNVKLTSSMTLRRRLLQRIYAISFISRITGYQCV